MAISLSDIDQINGLITDQPRPLTQIARLLCLKYKSLYDFIKSKKGVSLFSSQKIDGLVWIRPQQKAFDLTRGTQNSNKPKVEGKNAYRHNYGKTGPERKVAIHKALNEIDVRIIEDECFNLFRGYIERINDTEIVLAPNPEKYFFGDLVTMPYKTRFNDEGRKVEQLNKYERIFDEAAERWKHGVMLTLTTDPKMQDSLWDANKKLSKNLNKLMSYMARKNKGRRIPYLSVFEFQGNGRLHLHIVFFGVRFLLKKDEMVRLWMKYGQGKIVDFKSLKSDGKTWQWTHQKPKDAKEKERPDSYLKKYLKKNLYDEIASMQYWIYGTRFFSNSRMFEIAKTILPSLGWYYFYGCVPAGSMQHLPGHVGFTSNNGPPRYRSKPRAKPEHMIKLDKLCRYISQ